MDNIGENVEKITEDVKEVKKLSIRIRDVIIRLFVRIGKLITCNKITIKSSCCELIDNHTENHNMNIYNSPTRKKEDLKQ